jgi:hypothetical protein
MYQCQVEGLFEEGGIDFGRPIDFKDPEFVRYILECMTYRKGPMGDLLAEGMGRMIRALGKEKFGDTLRHGIFNRMGEERLTPVSWETSWGECSHWQGRGFQGCEKCVVVLTRNRGYRKSEKKVPVPSFIYKNYPRLRVALRNRNKLYNNQLELVERLEDEGKVVVIRPEKPIVVGRMETNVKKLTDLYEQGYACAKKVFEECSI